MRTLLARFHRWIGEALDLDDVHYRIDPRVLVLQRKVDLYAATLHTTYAELRHTLRLLKTPPPPTPEDKPCC